MNAETWLGLLILTIVIIVIWEILKGIYKKVKRKLYIKRIAGKARRGDKADMEPWYPKEDPKPPEPPSTPEMYKQPTVPSGDSNY